MYDSTCSSDQFQISRDTPDPPSSAILQALSISFLKFSKRPQGTTIICSQLWGVFFLDQACREND